MQVQKIRGVEQRTTEGALAKVPYNCDTNFGEFFNEHASGMHLAITASYIQYKIASDIVSLHVLDVFNPICQISSCVMPFFLIIWLEFSLLRPYILLLAHESPNFVCNTLFNTLTRIDVNKNGVCDMVNFFSSFLVR